MNRSVLLGMVLATAIVTGAAAGHAAGRAGLPRSTEDRPDDTLRPRIHLMYVVPSDGADHQLDTNGTIESSANAMESWLSGQTGGRTFPLDTFQGQPDITFFRLRATAAEVESREFAAQEIETELHEAGYGYVGYVNAGKPPPPGVRDKHYAVFYGGRSKAYCGNSGADMAFVYLPDCHGIEAVAMVHELVHTLGFVPSCAPRYLSPGHVTDAADLMYPTISSTARLDPGHDDYYGAYLPGCHDLASSRFWSDGGVQLTLSVESEGGGSGTVHAAASGTSWESSFPELPNGAVVRNPFALVCPPTCSGYADTWPTPTATVEADPAIGSDFVRWTGDCSGSFIDCRITLDRPRNVGAVFERTTPPRPLRVHVSVTGSGRVTSIPRGIACPRTCTRIYDAGTAIVLRASPASGWRFQGWRGACKGTRPCSLYVYADGGDQAVGARFARRR